MYYICIYLSLGLLGNWQHVPIISVPRNADIIHSRIIVSQRNTASYIHSQVATWHLKSICMKARHDSRYGIVKTHSGNFNTLCRNVNFFFRSICGSWRGAFWRVPIIYGAKRYLIDWKAQSRWGSCNLF